VALVYDSRSDGLRTGERSRFLHQLYYEKPHPVEEIIPPVSFAKILVKPVVIAKTGDVALALERYTGKEHKLLSPSAINEFLNCPVKFYFHHIAGLPQPEEIPKKLMPECVEH
jgi:hypothetical protein